MKQKAFLEQNEINRHEIMAITGASKGKIKTIIQGPSYNFPKSKRLVNRWAVYDRTAVMAWLALNDVSNIKILDYSTRSGSAKKDTDFNVMAQAFIFGR